MNSTAINARKRIRNGSIIALATLAGLALGASSIYKGCKVNEELEPLRTEFKVFTYLREPERRSEEINILDYNGILDEIVEDRNQLVQDRGCMGIGSWYVMESVVGNPDTSFNYLVLCPPF